DRGDAPVRPAAERRARRPRPLATRNPVATADCRGLLQHHLWYLIPLSTVVVDDLEGASDQFANPIRSLTGWICPLTSQRSRSGSTQARGADGLRGRCDAIGR